VEWVIADLKTTLDASPRKFAAAVMDRDYDLQMVWYCTLLGALRGLENPPFWVWIAVEKKAPFVNSIYTGAEFVESGTRKLEIVLDRWKESTASGEWPMPYRGINHLERPSWA
jgi:hypothetical protein